MEKFLSLSIVPAMLFLRGLWSGVAAVICATLLAISTGYCQDLGDCFTDENFAPAEVVGNEHPIPVYANDIAAVVNNEIITMAQVMREVSFILPHIRAEARSQADFDKRVREAREMVLNSMVERVLIIADFKAKGGQIPDSFGKKEYEAHVRSKFNGDRVAFAKFLRSSGISVREFKKDIREHAIVEFVLGDVLKAKEEISPIKIREYYDEHIRDFIIDRQVFVKEISLLKKKYDGGELQTKLDALMAAIGNGEGFQFIVDTFDDLPKSEIGWISVDQLIPEFSNALFGLGTGMFSNPIDLADRICILFLSNERPAKKFPIGEVSGDIEKILAAKYRAEVRDNYIKKLKERAYIKTFL